MTVKVAARWHIDDLDFSRISLEQARADENFFYLASCASFVESGSALYSRNLVAYFRDDPEVAEWLRSHWEFEELQHGRALRAYVHHVWPEFNWDSAYRNFFEEYASYCKVELLEPTQALELAARCVVETGTATYYGALSRSASEPVLRDLAGRIATDEVNHYKHFYRFFLRYREREATARQRVFATVARRTLALKSEDADCAIRHVVKGRAPASAGDADYVQQLSARMNATIRRNLHPTATLKMLMRPLQLPAALQTMVRYPVEQFMQRVFLR